MATPSDSNAVPIDDTLNLQALIPDLFARYFEFFRPGHQDGFVPSRIKELARLKIAAEEDQILVGLEHGLGENREAVQIARLLDGLRQPVGFAPVAVAGNRLPALLPHRVEALDLVIDDLGRGPGLVVQPLLLLDARQSPAQEQSSQDRVLHDSRVGWSRRVTGCPRAARPLSGAPPTLGRARRCASWLPDSCACYLGSAQRLTALAR